MSSTPPPKLPCDLCGKPVDLTNTTKVTCGCPHGSLGCHNCRSVDGQDNSPISGCCYNCYRTATRFSRNIPDNLRFLHVVTSNNE